jgi:uncharacterized protein
MHISLEKPEQYAVQAYGTNQLQINSIIYETSLIVSRQEIISGLEIKHLQEMNDDYMKLLLKHTPEIIIIGHQNTGVLPAMDKVAHLSQLGIGMECMSLGAACRTYNVLLAEERNVVLGIILNAH